MEKSNLNQKSWYRLLKVIFVITFIIVQLIGFSIVSAFTSATISYVYCDNGTGFQNSLNLSNFRLSTSNNVFSDLIPNKDLISKFRQCDETAYYFNSSSIKGTITDEQYKQLKNLVLQMKSQNVLMESDFQSAVDGFITQHANLSPVPKAVFSSKNFYKPEALDQRHYGPRILEFIGKDGNPWVSNFTIGNKNVYSFIQKVGYYFLSFLVVNILFWLISRIFFYVVVKEEFLKF